MSRINALVNYSCAHPRFPPKADPRALAFFCLGWQIPGGGVSGTVKSPGVRMKKENE